MNKYDHALIAEYQAAHDSFQHYDSFRWQSGSLLIAGSMVFWGVLLSKNVIAPKTMGISSLFISLILSCWILYAHHYRQLYLSQLHRIHEIEGLLNMKLHTRHGFKGLNKEKESIYHRFKKLLKTELHFFHNAKRSVANKREKSKYNYYLIFGPKGHNIDQFLYVVISLLGPVTFWFEKSFNLWLLSSLPVIILTIIWVRHNEMVMIEFYKEKKPNSEDFYQKRALNMKIQVVEDGLGI